MKGALLILLIGSPLAAAAETWLHVSGIASPPGRALLKVGLEESALEVEVNEGHLGKPFSVKAAQDAELTLVGDDGLSLPGRLRFRTAEEGGRHVLVVSPGLDNRPRLTLLPVDHLRHPMGGATFLNLSDNVLRCWLGPKSVEIAPGKSALHPSMGTARRIENHRVEYLDAGGIWRHESSSTLIFPRDSRTILTIGPGRAELGPLPRHNVMDLAPKDPSSEAEDFKRSAPKSPQRQPTK